jgi:hypothetical protein
VIGGQVSEDLAGALRGLPAYLVGEIPRRPEQRDTGAGRPADPGRGQRSAALTAAYHWGIAGPVPGRVALGWVRTAVGGAVRVIAAGEALVGGLLPGGAGSVSPGSGDGLGQVLLALPAGARATRLGDGELAGLIGALGCWRPVTVLSDPLLTAGGQPDDVAASTDHAAGLSLDEALLGSWTGPFGWLVTAEPLSAAQLNLMAEETGRQQRAAEVSADRFPGQAAEARRLQQRHTELQRGGTAGFWRITVAAGGSDEASAARVAGLLCAATRLTGLPYALSPLPVPTPRSPGPGQPVPDPSLSGCGSTELLAALARPP